MGVAVITAGQGPIEIGDQGKDLTGVPDRRREASVWHQLRHGGQSTAPTEADARLPLLGDAKFGAEILATCVAVKGTPVGALERTILAALHPALRTAVRLDVYHRLEELEVSGRIISIDLRALGLLGCRLSGTARFLRAILSLSHVVCCVLGEGWSDAVSHGESLTAVRPAS